MNNNKLQGVGKSHTNRRRNRYNLRVRFKDNRRKGLQVSDKGTVYVREEAKEMQQSWLDLRLICSELDASMKAEPILICGEAANARCLPECLYYILYRKEEILLGRMSHRKDGFIVSHTPLGPSYRLQVLPKLCRGKGIEIGHNMLGPYNRALLFLYKSIIAYLKGGQDMYEQGLLATVNVDKLAEAHIKEFEHLEIKLEEIKEATDNFNENNVIGTGGFGKVYKGELSHSEGKTMVAIKRLERKYGQGDPEFLKEIRMLSCYKHENLISLLGFCKEGDEMILIYELASRGSLDRILNKATLTWTQRLKICLDAAKGLSFLHDPKGTQQRILHRDIKSANILLDESLNAKVADFGLSKISPANQKYTFLFTSPVGTPGYCDPLYMDAYQLTKESDVYSFGVVLFEVLCGRVCYENSDRKLKIFVPYWKRCYEEKKLDEIIFPDLKHQLDPYSVETFADIAYQCLQKTREQRPTMSVVVKKLKTALEQEEMRKAVEYEYKEILKAADPPLRFLEFPVNGGKTLLSINDKGEVICERICIEACLDQIQYDRLQDPSGFENLRFSGGRCYCKDENELKVQVRAQFLYLQITYSVNLVFRNAGKKRCKTLHYKLNGEAKCFIVYSTHKREDGYTVSLVLHKDDSSKKQMYVALKYKLEGETETSIVYLANKTKDNHSFIAELYQFTSNGRTFDLDIVFEDHEDYLEVEGILFQPLEKGYTVDNNGKKSVMFSARGAIRSVNLSFESSPESSHGILECIPSRKGLGQ
ncbi:kinase-like domain, phloem protein 2-like protein [Tanacetum coccineum]|uniref:Kinase-like domain, phloem protein 2-like protein n=1 Tax=Tanacetum coccineum TaxID=301880 RepID=A0ABQ5AZF2_9ASTR